MKPILLSAIGGALLLAAAAPAEARSNVSISSGNYYQPAPVYYAPPPAYYAPPVYYAPAPVYYQPAPSYRFFYSNGWDRHRNYNWGYWNRGRGHGHGHGRGHHR